MIKAENLTKRYGAVTAVDNITFEIEKGEIVGFLGPNGAGKTSTMRVLTGFMPPTEGRVTVAGYDVLRDTLQVKRRIGYLPESTPLYTDMCVAEYLDFVGEVKGLGRAARKRKVAEVMDAAHVANRAGSLIGTLSKGYRQRVGLAQALINDPEVLVLDEPTIGLDPMQITDIRSLIKELSGRRTVILSSHILPEVQMICSRVMIINNGRLVAADTTENLAGRFKSGGRFVVKLEAPVTEAREAIERLPGVEGVTLGEAPADAGEGEALVIYNVDTTGGKEPRKALVRLVAEKGWDLVELAEPSLSLEEVYIKLVTEEGAPARGEEASS
ncbi:MAG: ABC transporter ATP-binding protein [Candidatus Nitrospinota bacterium M3_3B_026]